MGSAGGLEVRLLHFSMDCHECICWNDTSVLSLVRSETDVLRFKSAGSAKPNDRFKAQPHPLEINQISSADLPKGSGAYEDNKMLASMP